MRDFISAKMEESAEELLKSRGITDLRDMIGDLNEKAFQTKEELQLMVGSKYHDFIQSADAISFMKDSAENVGKKLERFSDINKALIVETKTILSYKGNDEYLASFASSALNSSSKSSVFHFTSGDVWACLDNCDVYTASKIVLVAQLLRDINNSSLLKFVTSRSRLEELVRDVKEAHPDFMETSYLLSTVTEDCYLQLLVPESTREKKIRALCSLGLLTGQSKNELIKTFLQSADIMLEEIFSDEKSGNHSRKLNNFIKCIQQVVLDVYYSFICGERTCAVMSLQSVFLLDIDRGFPSTGEPLFDAMVADFGGANTSDTDNFRLLFNSWLENAMKKASQLTERALGHMQSAVDVSHLQYEIWKTSSYYNENEKDPRRYTLAEWQAASSALLIPLSKKK